MEVKNQWKAWLYLAPALIVLIVFTIYPIFNTIFLGFQEGFDQLGVLGGETYEFGFGNFIKILDPNDYFGELFYRALVNTTLIVVVTVPCSIILALLVSVALNSIKPLQKFLQTIYFLPYITNTLAIAAVFAIIFQSSSEGVGATQGILNNLLEMMGMDPIDWLGGTNYWASMAVVFIYDIWAGLPFKILIILGALQSVNKQCYEAAKIDATPKRRVLTKITIPLISPTLSYLLITGFIGAFKEYTSVIGLFSTPSSGNKMGFDNFMITIVGLIYNFIDGDDAGQYGMAAASAIVLLIIIMIFTGINNLLSKKRVHY